MKKNDLFLASAVLIIALVWFLLANKTTDRGNTVIVSHDNDVINTYTLSDEGIHSINVDGTEIMKIDISNGKVSAIYSTCRDKLCVHQKAISNTNETIVCLPNRIVIELKNNISDANSEYDAYTY